MDSPDRRPEPLPPELADRFRLLQPLGAGAFGTVDAVQDLELDRELALKRLHGEGLGEEARRRFLRECHCLAQLDHPNVVRIHDAGLDGEGPWILMERLRGEPLDRARGLDDPVDSFLEIAGALDAIHAAGLVHRDIKPANLFRSEEGRLVLLDLGLARPLDPTTLTRTGYLVGTLAYLAPECFGDGIQGPPSDWYALGVSLYQLLEGRLPYRTEQLMTLGAGAELPPPPLGRIPPGSPEGRMIRALMEPRPGDRPECREALERVLRTPAPSPVPRPPAASKRSWKLPGALVALGLVGLAAGISWESPAPPPPEVPREVVAAKRPPPPHPELLSRARFFQELLPDPRVSHQDERVLLRNLPHLRDPAIGQRWRGFLHDLGTWLGALTEGKSTPEEIDRTLFAPEVLPHFQRLVLELPENYLDTTDEAAMRLVDPTYSPGSPELLEALDPSLRIELVKLRNEALRDAESWLEELPVSLQGSEARVLLQWAWKDKRMVSSTVASEAPLMDELLPLAHQHPAQAIVLEAVVGMVATPWFLRLRPCSLTLDRMELLLRQVRRSGLDRRDQAWYAQRLTWPLAHLRSQCASQGDAERPGRLESIARTLSELQRSGS